MKVLQGKGICGGLAKGPLHIYRSPAQRVEKRAAADPGAERVRLEGACGRARARLDALARESRAAGEKDAAELFAVCGMLAKDEGYLSRIESILDAERCNAEYAVWAAGEELAARFAAMEDAYLAARAEDLRDVSGRIVAELLGQGEGNVLMPGPGILLAEELPPSKAARLDREQVLGLALRGGSPLSHTAILARAKGIPAVVCLGEITEEAWEGRMALLDGDAGQVTLGPDGAALAEHEKKEKKRREASALPISEAEEASAQRIGICCNIASAAEARNALAAEVRGVGLFRTEFLYLSGNGYPSEEEQFREYQSAARAMAGGRVVIRTADLGADKQAAYLRLPKEENPALGLRGVRLSLARPEMFRTQLRALYRASAYGKIAVMFPMITSLEEVRACRAACEAVKEELRREGLPFDERLEQGVMIETPAAVLIAEELAREADFFSIGTNDLTQYLLACDRQAPAAGGVFDPRHPAVLRAVKLTADAARAAGIRVCVCGELAADPELLPVFLELGIDELSVAPSAVTALRRELRQME